MNRTDTIAAMIARHIPLPDGGMWAESFQPKWPDDFMPRERRIIRKIVRETVAASRAKTGERG